MQRCDFRRLLTGAHHLNHISILPLQNPFRETRELDGLSKALVDLPKAALYAAALAFVAVSGALGSYLGGRAPGELLAHAGSVMGEGQALSSSHVQRTCRRPGG